MDGSLCSRANVHWSLSPSPKGPGTKLPGRSQRLLAISTACSLMAGFLARVATPVLQMLHRAEGSPNSWGNRERGSTFSGPSTEPTVVVGVVVVVVVVDLVVVLLALASINAVAVLAF